MKILLVTMSMGIGGAETHILELAKGLKKRGITVQVASAGGVFVQELETFHIPHETLPLDNRSVFSMIAAKKGLETLILREKYDIVHAHARIPAFLCGLLHEKLPFRFVTTDHLDFTLTPVLRKLTDWGEFTFAVSEDLRTYLLENFHLNPKQIALTVNGVDTERFSPGSVENSVRKGLHAGEKKIILHISRLDLPVCHCASALMDAMLLLEKKAMLVIVGDGDGADSLRRKAENINETLGYDAILLVGAKADVKPYIDASDIVVAPSRAAMEGMASGKPTIVSGSQGHGGIFSENISEAARKSNFCFRGFPLPTPEILAKELICLLQMREEERNALGLACRSFIEREYSVDRMVESQLSAYEKLVKIPTRGVPEVLIAGYYGYGNLGDETLLSVIIRKIRETTPEARICVLSATPRETARYHMTDAVFRFDFIKIAKKMQKNSLFLFGGGSLLQDKTSNRSLSYYLRLLAMARKHGMKTAIFANGIGPVLREKNKDRIKTALMGADMISLRDEKSAEFCKKLCPTLSVKRTFDPAILQKNEGKRTKTEDFFVVIPKKMSEKEAKMLKKAVQTVPFRPIFVSFFDAEDRKFTEKTAEALGAEFHLLSDAASCMEWISSARFVLSQRLHGLIFATAAGVPMLSASEDEKLVSYLQTIGMDAEMCSEKSISRLLEREEELRGYLNEKLPEFRKLAEDGFAELTPYIQAIIKQRGKKNV